ncbi:MAG: PocR ligand-binding domain-containing protein [Desulfobacteraceae bacterium]|jgi:PAS domain S-box-containing protein
MKYELSSLIDEEKAQSILDAFCNAVGVAAAIIDMEGRVLVGSRWQKICTDFHRKNKDTFKKCIESDTILANKLHQGKRYSIYQCPNGLTDAASPIVIEGEHVANAFVGQFLLKTPDPDRFRRQAATYGFDENAYLEALEAVPVVKEHSLPAILDFLSGFAEMVAIMGLNHVKQREAQETLREREEKYRQIFENIQDIYYEASLAGKIIEISPSVSSISGYTREELIGADLYNLYAEPEKRAAFLELLLAQEKVNDYELDILDKDGSVRSFSLAASIVRHDQGQPLKIVGLLRDISERKKADREKSQLQIKLQQAQKMEAIGTLAGGIAHDFNNILGVIVGNAELAMLDLPETNPAHNNLQEVREAALRARDLVNQILVFARQKEHHIATIQVGPIAKESLKMLRSSIPTTVEIRQKIHKGLPTVLADPSSIQQIIMNLCTNAAQSMDLEGGTLEVTLNATKLDAPRDTLTGRLSQGRYLELRIRDTGPGIAEQHVERIFDPFFTTKEVGEGTGLGLAVVHGIVQDRQGGITVETDEGKGTTFTVYLPASGGEPLETEKGQEKDLPFGTERVLFVDDEPTIRMMIKKMLERQGYEVQTRGNGAEALESFKQDPRHFDLVVTDMTMPGMTGDKLAESMLAIRPDLPIILCTGYNKKISKEKARDLGIRAFVMKPLTQNDFAHTVRRVLDET